MHTNRPRTGRTQKYHPFVHRKEALNADFKINDDEKCVLTHYSIEDCMMPELQECSIPYIEDKRIGKPVVLSVSPLCADLGLSNPSRSACIWFPVWSGHWKTLNRNTRST